MQTDVRFLRPLVEQLLRRPNEYRWTVQGFGFIRTYLGPPDNPKKIRLNVWHSAFTVPNVSTIHDHPWDFTSVIVAGQFRNQRYRMVAEGNPTHTYSTIKTGEGGGLEKSPFKHCALKPETREYFEPGDTYYQKADEIHETMFTDGSVTINERIGDTERARVFWPYGTDWVDAIPRTASTDLVYTACDRALEWFNA